MRACLGCGDQFEPHRRSGNKQLFCSRLCGNRHRSKHGASNPGVGGRPKGPVSTGNGSVSRGYRYVWDPDRHKQIPEHRLVMERALSRPLSDVENVHHINGDKLDNRIENLELWVISQPSGQRVVDLIDWLVEHHHELLIDALGIKTPIL